MNMNVLSQCTNTNTYYICFDPKLAVIGKVVRIYDGDTVDICLPLPNTTLIYKFKCRLIHYDTPERRSKNPIEKRLAQIATNKLTDILLDKIVKVVCHKYDKYGRVLCEVFDPVDAEESVNMYMLKMHYGMPYNGAKKASFEDAFKSGYFDAITALDLSG